MKKSLIGAGIALALVLTGCAPAPAPTVTVTADSGGSSNSNGGNTDTGTMSADETFDFYMDYLGVDELYAYSPALDTSLRDLAKSTCEMFDAGFTKDEVNMLAVESLGADDGSGMYEMVSMAMVAGTHAYCPEWTYVWGN